MAEASLRRSAADWRGGLAQDAAARDALGAARRRAGAGIGRARLGRRFLRHGVPSHARRRARDALARSR